MRVFPRFRASALPRFRVFCSFGSKRALVVSTEPSAAPDVKATPCTSDALAVGTEKIILGGVRIRIAIVAASLSVLCVVFCDALNDRHHRALSFAAGSQHRAADLIGDNPIPIRPDVVRLGPPTNHAKFAQYANWIANGPADDDEPSVRSRAVHVCRLWTFVPSLPQWLARDDRGIIDRVLIGKPAWSPSWRGLDVAERGDQRRSEHRDQMLSTLAELGVPLSATIGADDAVYTVRDLLRTSMNEFHLGQREIEWTTVAYARYLPPQSRWRNRFGEQYSFDLLARELMGRSLTRGSCRGIHLLTALTTVLLCDREAPFLTAETRDSVSRYLRRFVDAAVVSQEPDGCWPLRWAPDGYFDEEGEFTAKASQLGRVVVAGHLLEWFHWLPRELKPPNETVRLGLIRLAAELEASTRDSIVKGFCPYTHALTALFLASPP